MKTKLIWIALLTAVAGTNAFAQEIDDMYFTAKDRAKINQNAREEFIQSTAKEKGTNLQTINPSDSYSARNENPDYVAGSKVGSNSAQQTSSYFTSNYVPNINPNLYNCNCNSGFGGYNNYAYGNPYYTGGGYGMYGFGSPYSSFYPYGYSPYGFGMSSLGFGYGMGYGAYSMWGSPSMSFWNSYYGMGSYYGYGYPSYGYGFGGMSYFGGYPYTSYAVSNYNPDNTIVTGRRPARGGSFSQASYYNTNTARNSSSFVDANGRARGAAAHSSQSQYYQSGWRGEASRGGVSHTSTGARSSSFWNSGSAGSSNSNSGWNNSGWNRGSSSGWNNSGFSNSRGGGFSGGGFSGGGGGGGFSGGGGGHSGGGGRGRH